MKKLVFGLVATIAISACSKDKKNDARPVTPARTQDHKPAECPKDMAGSYVNTADPSGKFEIVINDGLYIVKDPENGDIRVDGTPAVGKADGSSITITCQNDSFVAVGLSKNGSTFRFTISKTLGGIRMEGENPGEQEFYQRVGAPTFPTETELNHDIDEMPARTPISIEGPDISQILEPDEVVTKRIECRTGYMSQYTIKVNGCSTGQQTFCSKTAYCAGLKDDVLNNGCAKSEREERYNKQCR